MYTWKLKYANSILEPSEYLCQISSKSIHNISSYTVSKLDRFLRHNVEMCSCSSYNHVCNYHHTLMSSVWLEWHIWTTSCILYATSPRQSVCTTQTHRVHSASSTSTEWNIHVTSLSAVMIDSCTSLSYTVSGEWQWMIGRTWSGWRLMSQSTAGRCHWHHVDCWWQHCIWVYFSSIRQTDNYYVLSWRRSTCGNCTTALRQHMARLSSVTAADQRTTCGRTRWVNC